MIMRRTGYFKEMPHAKADDPSIYESAGTLDLDQESLRKALVYMQDAPVLVACTGFAQNVIEPGEGCVGVPDCKTDGAWIWPGDFPYYVRAYKVAIDGDFLAHMRARGWAPSFDVASLDFAELEFAGECL